MFLKFRPVQLHPVMCPKIITSYATNYFYALLPISFSTRYALLYDLCFRVTKTLMYPCLCLILTLHLLLMLSGEHESSLLPDNNKSKCRKEGIGMKHKANHLPILNLFGPLLMRRPFYSDCCNGYDTGPFLHSRVTCGRHHL